MFGIVIAFKNLNFAKGILKSDWAGFSNFEYLFKRRMHCWFTRNTILYNVAFIAVNTFTAILIAILLSEIRSKSKIKLFQSCVLIPSLISIIIVSYLTYAFPERAVRDLLTEAWRRQGRNRFPFTQSQNTGREFLILSTAGKGRDILRSSILRQYWESVRKCMRRRRLTAPPDGVKSGLSLCLF